MAYEEIYIEFWSSLRKKDRRKTQKKLRELDSSKGQYKKIIVEK